MEQKNIKVEKKLTNNSINVSYDEHSKDKVIIEKKELVIKSLAFIQLLCTTMDDSDPKNVEKLERMISTLGETYDNLESALFPNLEQENEQQSDFEH